jgi:CRP/FNR family transcriptional regulator, cyclic AMP receptor protein
MSRLFEKYGRSFKEGETIFREGDAADGLYMIHSGQVKIVKKMGAQNENITTLEDPEFFGEMAIISAEPRSATAIALTDCKLIKMGPGAFEQSIRENHGMAISMVRLLTRRLRETNDLLSHFFNDSRQDKILRVLLHIALISGKKDKSGKFYMIAANPSIKRASEEANIPAADVRLMLRDMKDEGLLQIKKDASGNHLIGLPCSE